MAWFGMFRRKTGMNPFSIRPHLIFATVFSLLPAFAFAGFTGPVVSVLDGDTIEVLHNTKPERVRLSGIDCPEKGQAYGKKAKHTARRPSRPRLNLCLEKMSSSRPTARTNTGAPLLTYSYGMALTSIMNWSRKAGAGGIGSMRQLIPCWQG
jgi:hypothetical protein